MIGNITKGTDFGGLFRYLLKANKDAQIVGGNVGGSEPHELAAEFLAFSRLNERVKNVVTHISIGFATEDGVIDPVAQERIGTRIIEEMGYGHAQYLIVSHGRNDPGHDEKHHHDHFHLVANSVALDGKFVHDRLNYPRLEKILRQIERDEGLKQIESSWEVKKHAPTHGQTQRYKREVREVAEGIRETATLPVSERLQMAIDTAAARNKTVVEFARQLAELGIRTQFKVTRTGKVQGISYGLEGVSYQGNQLYDASLPKLQSVRGLTFNPVQDVRLIGRITVNPHPLAISMQISVPLPIKLPVASEQVSVPIAVPAQPQHQNSVVNRPVVDLCDQIRHDLIKVGVGENIISLVLDGYYRSTTTSVPSPVTAPTAPAMPNATVVTPEPKAVVTPKIVEQPLVIPPTPLPKTDPRTFNQQLKQKGEKYQAIARQEALQEIERLDAVPKRSLLNWTGMTERQLELERDRILADLATEIKRIERVVSDESLPLPPPPNPESYLERLKCEAQEREQQRSVTLQRQQRTHDLGGR